MKTIGIDIGTTSISAVVIDGEKQQILEAKTIANDCFIEGKNSWARIQDAELLVSKAEKLLDELLARHPKAEAIGLTGQMHGIVYLNSRGESVSPLYTWQDGSGDQKMEQGTSLVEELWGHYQIPAASGYGLITHLYHVRTHQVPEEAVSMATIADYLGMRLTKRTKPLMHTSNGASLGFYDSEHFRFLEEILTENGIDCGMLPEVTKEIRLLGTYQGRLVTVAIGDNQAGYLGAVGKDRKAWLLNMGTGGQISVYSGQYFEGEGLEARPFLGDSYLLVGAILCGGRGYAILEMFFEQIAEALGCGKEKQYDLMEKLVRRSDIRAGGMTAETTFQGTRTDPDRRGSIRGISEENFTPENLIRAVLNGIIEEYMGFYRQIYEGTGLQAEHLVVSGNGIRKNKVMQEMLAERFQTELIFSPYTEEAAAGAAMLPGYLVK